MSKNEISKTYTGKIFVVEYFLDLLNENVVEVFCPQVHTIDESSSSWVQSV